MEKKYISIDQLWLCETCFYMGSNGKCRSDCDAVESYRPAYSKFEFADVVPVVRCKDCGYYTDYDVHKHKRLELHFCNKFGNITRESDYCSYGRRKDGNKEKQNA